MIQYLSGRWVKYLAVLAAGATMFETEGCALDSDTLSTLLTDLIELATESILTTLSS